MTTCISQINQGRWCQEHYETGSPDIKIRAKALRELGYRVLSSSLGNQVTRYGRVRITMLHIEPGQNEDTIELPEVKELYT